MKAGIITKGGPRRQKLQAGRRYGLKRREKKEHQLQSSPAKLESGGGNVKGDRNPQQSSKTKRGHIKI